MEYIKPNFEHEWKEAERYPEFVEMGKDAWVEKASKDFEINHYNNIKDVLGNVDLDFDSLEDEKKKRFINSYKKGKVEIPIAVKFSDDDYDLIGGNTRLSGLVKQGKNPKIWVINMTNLNEEKLKGGLADGKTLKDVAKKHKIDIDLLKLQLQNGTKLEKSEHVKDGKTAKEIALDHLWEDPTYYIKLKKVEKKDVKETDASSSGGFEGPAFAVITKKKLQEEILSTGEYDVPAFGKTPKGNKNPLKIGGTETIYKNRAVKDKKWPRFGGPKAVYVKVKEKCKKFPYCNQGDQGNLEFIHEDQEIMDAIRETSEKYGIPYSEMEKIVLNEINKIFI